jgi:flagellar hook-associated protein 3 FlgL
MVQRVGNGYNLLIVKQAIAVNRAQHTKAMEPLATGRRINHLSDDPARLAEFFRVSNDNGRIAQYNLNISTAKTRINITDNVLSQTTQLIQEVNDIALQGNTQTLNQTEINGMTQRLSDIKAEILDMANSKMGSNYLFSGFKFSTQPFTGNPVTYNGDSNTISVKVTAQKNVQVSVDGDSIFTGGGGGKDIFATIDNLISDIQSQNDTQIGADITDLQDVQDQVLTARTTLGNSSQSLDSATTFLSQLGISSAARLGEIADVDMAKAATDLSFYEFTLKSAFAITQRVLSITTQSFLNQ